MKTSFAPGHELDFIAGATIASGDMVVAGSIVGISAKNYVNGEAGVMEIVGIHKLTKVAAQVWTQGQPVYKSAAAQTVSNVSTSNTFMGYAAYAAAGSDPYAYVLLARPGS